MTAAKERDVESLIGKYGADIEAVPGLACYLNGLNASLIIFLKSGGKIVPRLWCVETEAGVHTYLQYEGMVYNRRVTWPDNTYPDFPLEELKKKGTDVTIQTLVGTLEEVDGNCLSPIGLVQLLHTYSRYTYEEMVEITRLVLVTAVGSSTD